MTELKPCPFCGQKARKYLAEENRLHIRYWAVQCFVCHCRTAGYQDYDKAVRAWNRRVTDDKERC